MLIAYPFAKLLVRGLHARWKTEEGEPRGTTVLRALIEAVIWPVTGVVLLALATEIRRMTHMRPVAEPYAVLSILIFFVVYRLVNELVRQLVPASNRRKRLRVLVIPTLFALAVLDQLDLLGTVARWMERPFAHVGGVPVSVFSILGAIAVFLVFIFVGRLVSHVLGSRILPGVGVDPAIGDAMGTVLRYVLIVLGFVVALEAVGFSLTTLQIGFGALGVGIGFGLQNLVNNFVSGLILLFERTVKRGDILTAAETDGRVVNIGLRSSVMRTRQGDDIIVPNSMLVSDMVTNYSYGDRLKRLDVDVGVSYGSDPRQVEAILLEEAEKHERVLSRPKPNVMFMAFGDSALLFQLRAWLDNPWLLPHTRSDLLFAIWYRFKEEGIEIPFPQRDLHVRSGELKVRQAENPAG
jgi:small-conductance mechanosensitive channel